MRTSTPIRVFVLTGQKQTLDWSSCRQGRCGADWPVPSLEGDPRGKASRSRANGQLTTLCAHFRSQFPESLCEPPGLLITPAAGPAMGLVPPFHPQPCHRGLRGLRAAVGSVLPWAPWAPWAPCRHGLRATVGSMGTVGSVGTIGSVPSWTLWAPWAPWALWAPWAVPFLPTGSSRLPSHISTLHLRPSSG